MMIFLIKLKLAEITKQHI